MTSDRKPKAVLFDFDGTLSVLTLDFKKMRRVAVEAMREVLGFFPEIPDADRLMTMELVEAVAATLPPDEAGKADAVREAAANAIAAYELEAASESSLFPFARPMLARLVRLGVKTAIITRNCREAVQTVFPDHTEYCSLILSRDDVEKVKPHPEHLLAALRHFGMEPEDAMMVGDHPMDVESAHKAGCLGAAVLGGEASYERLAAVTPDYLADDAGKLIEDIYG